MQLISLSGYDCYGVYVIIYSIFTRMLSGSCRWFRFLSVVMSLVIRVTFVECDKSPCLLKSSWLMSKLHTNPIYSHEQNLHLHEKNTDFGASGGGGCISGHDEWSIVHEHHFAVEPDGEFKGNAARLFSLNLMHYSPWFVHSTMAS